MDANHLNKLLIAFSNSEIPLEIQGLRFHRSVALQVAKSPETKKNGRKQSARTQLETSHVQGEKTTEKHGRVGGQSRGK